MKDIITAMILFIFLTSVCCVDSDTMLPIIICVSSAVALLFVSKTYEIKEYTHKNKKRSEGHYGK